MKIHELMLASNNLHKKTEIQSAIPGCSLLLPQEKGIRFSCEETGTTFLDNAVLKARALFDLAGSPVIADDSGLCVKTLDGRPGIFSARFGREQANPPRNDAQRNQYLLSLLEHDRLHEAFFVCAMVLILDDYRVFVVQETVPGIIIHTPRGASGFGYDPVFLIPEINKTVAELSLEEKNSFSHRGRAARKIRLILSDEQ